MWFQVIIYHVGINIKISVSDFAVIFITFDTYYDSYLKYRILQKLNHLYYIFLFIYSFLCKSYREDTCIVIYSPKRNKVLQ